MPQAYISCIKTPYRSQLSNKSPIIISKHHFEFLLVAGLAGLAGGAAQVTASNVGVGGGRDDGRVEGGIIT